MRRLLAVLWEGWLYLRVISPRGRLLPSEAYLQWRLGTVYGSFDVLTGRPRDVGDLLVDLWRDRANVFKFLLWRRDMRLRAKRSS
jgi:hypothetical protein